MAERRMFAKTIIDSDAFLDMPMSARLLYYDLAMRADDDGFVNSPKKIMKMVGATPDDLTILSVRKFIIPFDNGVVVIKHWYIHNYIRKDTYNETQYKEQKEMLEFDENKSYRFVGKDETTRQRAVDGPSTQVSIYKERIDYIDNNVGSCSDQINEILDYLNQKTGKRYTARSKSSVKIIRERLKEGYTVDEFKTVIQNKTNMWLNNPDMKIYLRPETLFCAKHFDSYLNDVEDEKQKRKREETEINERQREAIKQSNEFGFE